MVSICIVISGPIHQASVTRINYYLMMGVDVVYSTWTPVTYEEKYLFKIIQKHLPPSKISAVDLPRDDYGNPSYQPLEGHINWNNRYYQCHAVLRGLALTTADVTVKHRSSFGLGNIGPLIRLINENPDKIIACNILTFPVKERLYSVSDCLFAMKTEQQVEAWNSYKSMLRLNEYGNNSVCDIFHAEQQCTYACLLARGVVPNMSDPDVCRSQLSENYVIFDIFLLDPELWIQQTRGVLDEGFIKHNIRTSSSLDEMIS